LSKWLLRAGIACAFVGVVGIAVWIASLETRVALRFANYTQETIFVTSVAANGRTAYKGPPAEHRPVRAADLQHTFTQFDAPRARRVTLAFGIRDRSGREQQLSCVFEISGPCIVEIRHWDSEFLSCFCDFERVS
jgi:hypothetical protein